MSTPPFYGNESQKLIENLREEAAQVKHCFTQFSFAVMTFGSALFAVILQYSGSKPYVGFIGILMALICIYTARIGNHKYLTANRNNAYELHLQRLRHYKVIDHSEATQQMLDCGWEEAMFAWRIMSSAVRDQLYASPRIRKIQPWRLPVLRKEYRYSTYPWFDTKLLVRDGRYYSPGRYLFHMQSILNILAVAALSVGIYSGIKIMQKSFAGDGAEWMVGVAVILILTAALPWSLYQMLANRLNRKILESGLFSIQSSAVLWRCTVIAHFRALERSTRFKHYTAHLRLQTESLTADILKVHTWMAREDEFPAKACPGFIIDPLPGTPDSDAPF